MAEITGDGTPVQGLGGALGFGETALARGDEGFAQIDASAVFEAGLNLGDTVFAANALFVSTDGLITFGAGVSVLPSDPSALTMPFLAPFLADIDTRLDGEGAESGQIWVDVDSVQDCVTITWADVGFYRRNASATNSFQVQLFDLGGGAVDVVFRYGSVEWTSGDLQGGSGGLGGTAAQAGYRIGSTGSTNLLAASGNEAALLALPQTPGNTGIAGLYVFHFTPASAPVTGGAGDDTLTGTSGFDTLQGLGGADVLLGSAGGDLLDGGTGTDRADYGAASAAIGIDLASLSANQGWAAGDRYIGIERFFGSAADDFLFGDAFGNDFSGGGGADSLDGRGGNDALWGEAGNDLLLGRAGNDVLDGGAGDDQLWGGGHGDTLSGGAGADRIRGNHGNDSALGGEGDDWLTGENGNDSLSGEAGNDLIGGNAGDDWLWGGEGDDWLQGHSGNDWLSGDAGADRLEGGNGLDTLLGGSGADLLFGRAGDDGLFGGDEGDVLYGNPGDDILWGEGGNDTLAGGRGRDHFAHGATLAEGTDRITDYAGARGDRLWFAAGGAQAADFSVQRANSGGGAAAEAVITYLPTGQVLWILDDIGSTAPVFVLSGADAFILL